MTKLTPAVLSGNAAKRASVIGKMTKSCMIMMLRRKSVITKNAFFAPDKPCMDETFLREAA